MFMKQSASCDKTNVFRNNFLEDKTGIQDTYTCLDVSELSIIFVTKFMHYSISLKKKIEMSVSRISRAQNYSELHITHTHTYLIRPWYRYERRKKIAPSPGAPLPPNWRVRSWHNKLRCARIRERERERVEGAGEGTTAQHGVSTSLLICSCWSREIYELHLPSCSVFTRRVVKLELPFPPLSFACRWLRAHARIERERARETCSASVHPFCVRTFCSRHGTSDTTHDTVAVYRTHSVCVRYHVVSRDALSRENTRTSPGDPSRRWRRRSSASGRETEWSVTEREGETRSKRKRT